MSLLVTGTIGIDTVYTPHGHAEHVLGGSCTYFAAAASFFVPVRVVAAVGEDFPPGARATLERFRGIDLRGLETRAGAPTFRWSARYKKNLNDRETIETRLGVVGGDPPRVPEAYRGTPFVFLANTPPAVQLRMLDEVSGSGLVVADTMDLWISGARAELQVLLRRVHGLVLNYDEAEQLTGLSNAVAAARAIVEMGPRFVVVKKGEHGCLLAHRGEGLRLAALPAYPSWNVVDPTGAGDSFAGGFLGSLAARGVKDPTFEDLRGALAYGTVVASFTIEAFSLERLESLTREELDARFEEYAAMVRL